MHLVPRFFAGLTPLTTTRSWRSADWTASDDRVRGGKSQSYLHISDAGARFYGNLDIKTLGGAGFASQRTTAEARTQWDLSAYDGILLELGKSDGKRYTFILKDELLPRDPDNGREQATISWEYDFEIGGHKAGAESSVVFIPWKRLKPTYRGKEKSGARKLDTKSVKRFSIMMRRYVYALSATPHDLHDIVIKFCLWRPCTGIFRDR